MDRQKKFRLPPLRTMLTPAKVRGKEAESMCGQAAIMRRKAIRLSGACMKTAANSPLSASFSHPTHKKSASMSLLRTVQPQTSLMFPGLTADALVFSRCLGQGSIGRIMLTSLNGTNFAVKVMQKLAVKARKVADSEKSVLSQLCHHMIIRPHVWLEDEEQIYMVMDYLPKGDLFKLLRRRKLSNAESRFYAMEIAVVLRYLHRRKIVYRDLKPENVMLQDNGHIKLIDFGFAKRLEGERTNSFLGSPDYMSPEIVLKQPHSFPVDCWSYGVLLYELHARYTPRSHPPFQGDSAFQVYESILAGVIDFPQKISAACRDLIRKLLCPEAKYRPRMEEVVRHEYFAGVDWDAVDRLKADVPGEDKTGEDAGGTTVFDRF